MKRVKPPSKAVCCAQCRKSKVRCDKEFPCPRCKRLGVKCEDPQTANRAFWETGPEEFSIHQGMHVGSVIDLSKPLRPPMTNKAMPVCREKVFEFLVTMTLVRQRRASKDKVVHDIVQSISKALGLDTDALLPLLSRCYPDAITNFHFKHGSSAEAIHPYCHSFFTDAFASYSWTSIGGEDQIYVNRSFSELFFTEEDANHELKKCGVAPREMCLRTLHPEEKDEVDRLFDYCLFIARQPCSEAVHVFRCQSQKSGRSFMGLVRFRITSLHKGWYFSCCFSIQPLPLPVSLFAYRQNWWGMAKAPELPHRTSTTGLVFNEEAAADENGLGMDLESALPSPHELSTSSISSALTEDSVDGLPRARLSSTFLSAFEMYSEPIVDDEEGDSTTKASKTGHQTTQQKRQQSSVKDEVHVRKAAESSVSSEWPKLPKLQETAAAKRTTGGKRNESAAANRTTASKRKWNEGSTTTSTVEEDDEREQKEEVVVVVPDSSATSETPSSSSASSSNSSAGSSSSLSSSSASSKRQAGPQKEKEEQQPPPQHQQQQKLQQQQPQQQQQQQQQTNTSIPPPQSVAYLTFDQVSTFPGNPWALGGANLPPFPHNSSATDQQQSAHRHQPQAPIMAGVSHHLQYKQQQQQQSQQQLQHLYVHQQHDLRQQLKHARATHLNSVGGAKNKREIRTEHDSSMTYYQSFYSTTTTAVAAAPINGSSNSNSNNILSAESQIPRQAHHQHHHMQPPPAGLGFCGLSSPQVMGGGGGEDNNSPGTNRSSISSQRPAGSSLLGSGRNEEKEVLDDALLDILCDGDLSILEEETIASLLPPLSGTSTSATARVGLIEATFMAYGGHLQHPLPPPPPQLMNTQASTHSIVAQVPSSSAATAASDCSDGQQQHLHGGGGWTAATAAAGQYMSSDGWPLAPAHQLHANTITHAQQSYKGPSAS